MQAEIHPNSARAKIYRPAKTAMQSGKAGGKKWLLEFEAKSASTLDPIMGYTSSKDTQRQVKLEFDSQELAVAYAERNNIAYTLIPYNEPKRRHVTYTDNFKYSRRQPWTH